MVAGRSDGAEREVAVSLMAPDAVAYGVRLQYDPEAMELSDVEGSRSALNRTAVPSVALLNTSEPGIVELGDLSPGGNGVIANLTFRILDPAFQGVVRLLEGAVVDDLGRITRLPGAALEMEPLVGMTPALGQNYPFNPETSIPYELVDGAHVTLEIYNSLGQRVRTLVNAEQPRGSYQIAWDGRDVGGRAVSSGIYLARMTAGGFNDTRRMVLLK